MSVLIKGIDVPEKHHMNGYYISDDGRVFDIDRKKVVGKAIQCQKEQYNKLEQKDKRFTSDYNCFVQTRIVEQAERRLKEECV